MVLRVRDQVVRRSPCSAKHRRDDQQPARRPCRRGSLPREARSPRRAAHPGEGPSENERHDKESCTHRPAGHHPPLHDQQEAAPARHGGEGQTPDACCRGDGGRQHHAVLCTGFGHDGYDSLHAPTVALRGRSTSSPGSTANRGSQLLVRPGRGALLLLALGLWGDLGDLRSCSSERWPRPPEWSSLVVVGRYRAASGGPGASPLSRGLRIRSSSQIGQRRPYRPLRGPGEMVAAGASGVRALSRRGRYAASPVSPGREAHPRDAGQSR